MVSMNQKPSNKFILRIVSTCFLLFATSELIGAFDRKFTNVKYLLVYDAITKIIIVASLQVNAIAELMRERTSLLEVKTRFSTQVRIPGFVFLTLLMAMSIAFAYAILVIIQPTLYYSLYRTDDLNGYFIANIFLDMICYSMLWARGRDLFFEAPEDEITRVDRAFNLDDGEFGKLDDELDFTLVNSTELEQDSLSFRVRDFLCPTCVSSPTHQLGSPLNKNINMVSAICHLSIDSIKAIASLIAGLVSLWFDINVLTCYAWSSVGALIIGLAFIVIPLAKEIVNAAKDLYNNHGLYSKVTVNDDIDDNVVY